MALKKEQEELKKKDEDALSEWYDGLDEERQGSLSNVFLSFFVC